MAIEYIKNSKIFHLYNNDISYVIKIYLGEPCLIHFGKRVHINDDVIKLHSEYPVSFLCQEDGEPPFVSREIIQRECATYGLGDFRYPSLSVEDGVKNNAFNLSYCGYEILETKEVIKGMPSLRGGQSLKIFLQDEDSGLRAELHYTIYEDCNVVARSVKLKNASDSDMNLKRAFSFCMDFDGCDYNATYLYGKHSAEANIEQIRISHGVKTISSTTGTTSHKANPFIALSELGANEESGNVVGVNLIYSGSFSISVEVNHLHKTRLTGGINDFNFDWTLHSDEEFATPEAVICYSDEGFGGMSRQFHYLYKNYLICSKFEKAPCPIVINSWESAFYDFNDEKLYAIIEKAKNTGIDIFVLDDGWFKGRNSDKSSLGDWETDTCKLKHGLKGIVEKCKDCGLKFGIWIEPEMISKDSDLYREHTDWALKNAYLKNPESRNQLVLDLTKREVLTYIKNAMGTLLRENEISYVKWDMNRYLSGNYSEGLKNQGEFMHRYMLAVYELCEYLTTEFPSVVFEGCAGGGGRVDAGMMYYFPMIWASDSTDANDRTKIMYGWSLCYPLSSLSGHITCVPNHQNNRETPLNSRFDIAALGAFGFEFDISDSDEADYISDFTKKYREVESVTKNGNLYRLRNPFQDDDFSLMIVNREQTCAYLWVYQSLVSYLRTPYRLKLRGLCPDKLYRVENLGLQLYGDILMNLGLQINPCYSDFESRLLKITEVR